MQSEQEKDAIKELTQSDLNQDMVDLGVGRYRARIESAKKREAESETKYGQRLIRGGRPDLLEGHQRDGHWLGQPEQCALAVRPPRDEAISDWFYCD